MPTRDHRGPRTPPGLPVAHRDACPVQHLSVGGINGGREGAGPLDAFDTCSPVKNVARDPDGRVCPGRTTSCPTGRRHARPPDIEAIRTWARANGFSVSERGRIAHSARSAFYESQRNPAATKDPTALIAAGRRVVAGGVSRVGPVYMTI